VQAVFPLLQDVYIGTFTECFGMHVQQCLGLKNKHRDAIIDKNGETAAPPDGGVVAAYSLVAIESVRVSAILTECCS
jgi:hypothetical protein